MPKYKYLIVGGGMTADAAAKGIREVDADGSLGIISADPRPPYDRPPLSKGLWKGKEFDTIWRGTQDLDLDLHLGRTVEKIDPQQKQVEDDQGTTYSYEKMLLATGGSPRQLPFGSEHITYFRTVNDYEKLRRLADKGGRFAILGGGFIGSEIAAALRMNDQEVVMLFPEQGIGDRVFPAELSKYITDYYREQGVEVMTGELVNALEKRGGRLSLSTESGQEVVVDYVVAGLGIIPNVELAAQIELDMDNGIIVDEYLRSSQEDIYAAGDVAAFYSPTLAKRLRVEHEDNANMMGRVAGLNMAGKATLYHHLPFFYSDLFDLGYEAVGELDSRLETVVDWQEPFRKGVVYYMETGRVRGVLLWDKWGQIEDARALIAETETVRPQDLKGRL